MITNGKLTIKGERTWADEHRTLASSARIILERIKRERKKYTFEIIPIPFGYLEVEATKYASKKEYYETIRETGIYPVRL